MPITPKIQGFSKLSREDKIRIASEFAAHPVEFARVMIANWHPAWKTGEKEPEFTENAVSDYRLPYSIAPNFLIDGREYMVPMVTDESSVIAAAAAAAKYWYDRGGFITSTGTLLKPGHIHFIWLSSHESLKEFFNEISILLPESVKSLTSSMKARGGGIENISLKNLTANLDGYYQIEVLFNTVDAMGANFINSCLETMSEFIMGQARIKGISENLEIIMSILSNYTPHCLVKCMVTCNIDQMMPDDSGLSGTAFLRRFELAVNIAQTDINRAVTHNKGIFNGVDALIIATGNDFRAVEAAGHSWACRNGTYRGLSEVRVSGNEFEFSLEIPMPLGVTGGLTNLHPMAKASLQLLGNPDARKLMSVAASAGMANHFSAIRALITVGIQNGHMRLHLINILNQLNADDIEKETAIKHFSGRKISYSGVRDFLSHMRSN
jgi:hydroxymethylglutaryl-CoA reductase